MFRVNIGELEGDTVVAVVFMEGKKCFGRVKLNVCEGVFICLLDIVIVGGVTEFKIFMLKGSFLGDEGGGFCSCCCFSKIWL